VAGGTHASSSRTDTRAAGLPGGRTHRCGPRCCLLPVQGTPLVPRHGLRANLASSYRSWGSTEDACDLISDLTVGKGEERETDRRARTPGLVPRLARQIDGYGGRHRVQNAGDGGAVGDCRTGALSGSHYGHGFAQLMQMTTVPRPPSISAPCRIRRVSSCSFGRAACSPFAAVAKAGPFLGQADPVTPASLTESAGTRESAAPRWWDRALEPSL
jgi:hypothetical protein